MKLNKTNGDLNIDELLFTARISPRDIENLSSIKQVECSFKNENYSLYSIMDFDNDEIGLMFSFSKEKLNWIAIGVRERERPFEITEKDRRLTRAKIEQIGGEFKYAWGIVEIVEDSRAGDIYIKISFI